MAKFNFAEVTTVPEVAELWHVNPRTVQRWCDFGYVDACKIGGLWVISTRSVIARCGEPDVPDCPVGYAVENLRALAIS